MRRLRYAVPAALLALALTACSGETKRPSADDAPSATGASPTGPAPSSPTGDPPSPATSATEGTRPAGGTAETPAPVEPRTALLDWRPVPGPVEDTVIRSGRWTLSVAEGGSGYELSGAGRGSAGGGGDERVSDALMDSGWAVVVLQDVQERRPSRALVTHLASGRRFALDGRSEVPTTNGGAWALGDGRLLHATVDPAGSYCLASVDLRTRRSTRGWCAPPRNGFTGLAATPAGDSLMTFDDGQPSCRTVAAVRGTGITPFPGVPDCKGWEGLLLGSDSAVWGVIPRERAVEEASFHARVGSDWFDLGPGTSGSLTWCAGSAYFVRDPQRRGEPAQLLEWNEERGLTVVYQSPGGQAFLTEPRCGGRTLTLTALAQDGDEQVSADLTAAAP